VPNGAWKHSVGETFYVSEVFVQHYLIRFCAPFDLGITSCHRHGKPESVFDGFFSVREIAIRGVNLRKIKFGTAFAFGSAQPSVFWKPAGRSIQPPDQP
jgi:hypothetical protein